MPSLAELNTRLAEAEAALHSLNTHQVVAEVQIDNIRTRYAIPLDGGKAGLTSYITDLRAQIATVTAGISTVPARRAPIGVIW